VICCNLHIFNSVYVMCFNFLLFFFFFSSRRRHTRSKRDWSSDVCSSDLVIPWLGFQDALAKSSTVIIANANLVKQVIFPVEILPVKGVISSLATQPIRIGLLVAYMLAVNHVIPWPYVLTPLLFVIQARMLIGDCY